MNTKKITLIFLFFILIVVFTFNKNEIKNEKSCIVVFDNNIKIEVYYKYNNNLYDYNNISDSKLINEYFNTFKFNEIIILKDRIEIKIPINIKDTIIITDIKNINDGKY